MIELKNFLSREYFLQHSNAKDILLENMFNITYLKNDFGTIIESVDDFDRYITFNASEIETDIFDFLKLNTFAITLSDIISDSTTQFMNNIRKHTYTKRNDKNISISFIESSDLKVRQVIEEWINMTLPEYEEALYRDDYCVDIGISPVNHKYEEKSLIIYEKCVPVSYENIELNLGADVSLKLVVCEFVYRKNSTI